jgi:hypothetical protein
LSLLLLIILNNKKWVQQIAQKFVGLKMKMS